jgi:hypothetical protein
MSEERREEETTRGRERQREGDLVGADEKFQVNV